MCILNLVYIKFSIFQILNHCHRLLAHIVLILNIGSPAKLLNFAAYVFQGSSLLSVPYVSYAFAVWLNPKNLPGNVRASLPLVPGRRSLRSLDPSLDTPSRGTVPSLGIGLSRGTAPSRGTALSRGTGLSPCFCAVSWLWPRGLCPPHRKSVRSLHKHSSFQNATGKCERMQVLKVSAS
jgi:hypothetical protein